MASKSVKCAASRVKLKNRQNHFYSQIIALVQGLGGMWMIVSLYIQLGRENGMDAMKLIGFTVMIPSLLLWTLSRIQLGRCCSLFPEARKLVTVGMYSKIRNPVYIFGTLTVFSYTLVIGNPLYLLMVIVIIPIQYYRASAEAKLLELQFGPSYRIYAANVWI